MQLTHSEKRRKKNTDEEEETTLMVSTSVQFHPLKIKSPTNTIIHFFLDSTYVFVFHFLYSSVQEEECSLYTVL